MKWKVKFPCLIVYFKLFVVFKKIDSISNKIKRASLSVAIGNWKLEIRKLEKSLLANQF